VLPFGGKVLKATFTGSLLKRVLDIGVTNRGTGGFLHSVGVPATIEPAGRYTLAITDFLLTGGETNLGFLTRQNPEVSDIQEFRDIRMAVIDQMQLMTKKPGAQLSQVSRGGWGLYRAPRVDRERVIGTVTSRRRLSRRISSRAAVPTFESARMRIRADASSTVRPLNARMMSPARRPAA
jgi:hypothetical protein